MTMTTTQTQIPTIERILIIVSQPAFFDGVDTGGADESRVMDAYLDLVEQQVSAAYDGVTVEADATQEVHPATMISVMFADEQDDFSAENDIVNEVRDMMADIWNDGAFWSAVE